MKELAVLVDTPMAALWWAAVNLGSLMQAKACDAFSEVSAFPSKQQMRTIPECSTQRPLLYMGRELNATYRHDRGRHVRNGGHCSLCSAMGGAVSETPKLDTERVDTRGFTSRPLWVAAPSSHLSSLCNTIVALDARAWRRRPRSERSSVRSSVGYIKLFLHQALSASSSFCIKLFLYQVLSVSSSFCIKVFEETPIQTVAKLGSVLKLVK